MKPEPPARSGRRSVAPGWGAPPKLVDCRDHGEGSELFVVEGDSAARSVAAVRDERCQAVLPMQGKPLNAARASRRTVAANPLFAGLVEAMGTGWDEAFDLGSARYGRVLLLTDPDADGIHCGVLLLFFFHRWMRGWLEAGRLEVVQPPMFRLEVAGMAEPLHLYTEQECHDRAAELARSGATVESRLRYRGLGSIDPATLRELCLDPSSRRAFRLRPEDAEAALAAFSPPRPA